MKSFSYFFIVLTLGFNCITRTTDIDPFDSMQAAIERMRAMHNEALKEFDDMEKYFEKKYEALSQKSTKGPGWKIAIDDRRHIDAIVITIFNINTTNVDSAYGDNNLYITTDRERIKVSISDTNKCLVAIRQRRRQEEIINPSHELNVENDSQTTEEQYEDEAAISRIVSQSRPLSCGVDLGQAVLTYKRSLNQLVISMPKNEKPCTQQIAVDMID